MVGFLFGQAARCGQPPEALVYHGAAGMSKTSEKRVSGASAGEGLAFQLHSQVLTRFKVIAGYASAERRVVVERQSSRL